MFFFKTKQKISYLIENIDRRTHGRSLVSAHEGGKGLNKKYSSGDTNP